MLMDNNDQRNLSEQLQLLHELKYSDFDIPHQGYSNRRSRDTNRDAKRDARLLDHLRQQFKNR